MSESWMLDIENKVYSLIKAKTRPILVKKYPGINYTTSDINSSKNPKFPCVYIHALSGSEAGSDNEGNTVNSVLSNIQIEVYSNASQSDNKVVMATIIDTMKAMLYTVRGTPYNDNMDSVYRMIARFRRNVGSDDLF